MPVRDLARTRLDTFYGSAAFFPRPRDALLGVHVGMGGDGSASFWLSYDAAIEVRDSAGDCLAGIDPAGTRYLSMRHIDSEITMRAVADAGTGHRGPS